MLRRGHERLPPPGRANTAHVGQSRPDSGLGFRVEVLETFEGVPSSLVSGTWTIKSAVIPRRAHV